jgi:hypothetical protein
MNEQDEIRWAALEKENQEREEQIISIFKQVPILFQGRILCRIENLVRENFKCDVETESVDE